MQPTYEAVAVEPTDTLDHVSTLTRPLVDFSIGFHGVDQMRPSVLQRNGVTVVMVHLCQHVDQVTVERNHWLRDKT